MKNGHGSGKIGKGKRWNSAAPREKARADGGDAAGAIARKILVTSPRKNGTARQTGI
jgi:hypothetical protein